MTFDKFKTKPFGHQLNSFTLAKDAHWWGHLHEMGAGKTKIVIDNVDYLFDQGELQNVLVVSPNGVHRNWADREIEKHCYYRSGIYCWDGKPTSQKAKRALARFMDDGLHLRWMCMNIEAIRTPSGFNAAKDFCESGPTMMVVDESTIIKTPKAKQTKAAIFLSRLCKYRRILTGTPITQGPLDFYSQCKFLSPAALPQRSFTAFKSQFAHEKTMVLNSGKRFNTVIGYKNLDILKKLIEPYTDRILKKDCLDLPEKIYMTESIEMTTKQKEIYNTMQGLYFTQLEDQERTTGIVTAQNVLTLLMKLQQITTGFLIDDENAIHEIPNKRIEKLLELCSEFTGKAIIWCSFRENIRCVRKALRVAFGERATVDYYGDTDREARAEAIDRFQHDPECRFFISNKTGAEGITLTAAEYAIYYSNTYSLHTRLQSEDRCHRIGQSKNVTYIDIYARGTVDEKIMRALTQKQEIADTVLNNWRDLL